LLCRRETSYLVWVREEPIIGANAAAIILEVDYVEGETAMVIVHAKHAREKFLR
jgi:hypothetical protein